LENGLLDLSCISERLINNFYQKTIYFVCYLIYLTIHLQLSKDNGKILYISVFIFTVWIQTRCHYSICYYNYYYSHYYNPLRVEIYHIIHWAFCFIINYDLVIKKIVLHVSNQIWRHFYGKYCSH
jgi:hypothetical protein